MDRTSQHAFVVHWESPIQNSVLLLQNRKFLLQGEIDQLFLEFTHVKNYLKHRPNIFAEWNAKIVTIEARWMEIFSFLRQQNLSIGVFSKLIEYVLVMPGK